MVYIIDISCHKSVFPVDNVHASPGEKKACKCLKTILYDFGCSKSIENVEELKEHMQNVHEW